MREKQPQKEGEVNVKQEGDIENGSSDDLKELYTFPSNYRRGTRSKVI